MLRSKTTLLAVVLAGAAAAPAFADHESLVVGERVPAGAVFTVPRPIMARLAPAPSGYRYAVIDNDVVLVSDSTHLITKVFEDAVPVQTTLVVGHAVPAGATFVVPRTVLTRLSPAPAGFRYAVVNDDVVLVSNRTHRITKIYYDVAG